MQIISNFEELAALPFDTVVYNISNGECRKYWVLKLHEDFGVLYLVEGGDVRKTSSLYKTHGLAGTWLTGKYDSNFIGEIMVAQLTDKMDGVKRIYIK